MPRGRYSWRHQLRADRDAAAGDVTAERVHCPSCGAWLAAVDGHGRLYDVRRGVDYARRYLEVRCRSCGVLWGLVIGTPTRIIRL